MRRFSWTRLAAAAAVGALAALAHRSEPALVVPSDAAGLLDWSTAGLARVAPHAPLGTALLLVGRLALGAAVAATFAFARGPAGAWAAGAAALGLGLGPTLAPSLGPPDAFVAALAALALAFLLRNDVRAASWAAVAMAWLAPPVGLLFVAAVIVDARRSRARIPLALLLAAAGPALRFVIPALPPQVDGGAHGAWLPPDYLGTAWARVRDLGLAAGPYGLGLAALGAFSARAHLPAGRWPSLLLAAALPALLAGYPGVAPLASLSVLVVLLWGAIAIGLRVLVLECRPNIGGLIGSALLLALLPVLQYVRPAEAVAPGRQPHGHDTLTRTSFARLAAALPDGSVFVREDALTDALWRSIDGTWQKSGKALQTIARDVPGLPAIVRSSHPVVALPSAQAWLEDRGYRLVDAPPPQMTGVAHVEWGGACEALTQRWQDIGRVAAFGTVAIVAGDDASRGPVDILLAGDAAFQPRQLRWTAYAMPGYAQDVYDLALDEDRARLRADLAEADVPSAERFGGRAHSVALTIWRRPGAARVLTVDLGGEAAIALARYAPGEPQQLAVCPAFPHEALALGSER